MTLYGIGHSNRTLEFFVGLLLGYGVAHLVDIRTVPKSAFNPHFAIDSLPGNLKTVGIRYTHMKGLGGLRRPRPDSSNDGWKNSNFRGYADYMQTDEFGRELERLIAFAERATVAFMCAEAVPWRCHRSLVADALTAKGFEVRQIMSRVSAPVHQITPFAVVEAGKVRYPSKQATLF